MLPIGVLASGGGTNLQSIIDEIEAGTLKAEIKLVLSDKADAYALTRAAKHNIPTLVITKGEYPDRADFDEAAANALKKNGVELVVLAGFMRLLSKSFLEAFPERIINIHPSLLPAFPGLNVQKKALAKGVKFSGCTVHFVDEGLDSGPVINQAVVPVLSSDTVDTLSKRILEREHKLYPEAIRYFAEERVTVNGRQVKIKDAPEPDREIFNPSLSEEKK
ncbi:MAG: phosphoribosylglycinamide formyltransferase [Thermodesulfobacteriota bacterium]